VSARRAAGLLLLAFLVVLAIGFGRNAGGPSLGEVQTQGTLEPPMYVPTPAGTTSSTAGAVEYGTVDRVIDGDTIEVVQKGSERDVRVLGIDTPETVHPTKGVQCFGPEASAEVKRLLPKGTEVRLHYEGAEHEDRFGRLLAYVEFRAGADLSAHLARGGFARVYDLKSRYRVARTPELLALQAQARARGLGLWGACP